MSKIIKLLKPLARLSYVLGSASMLLGIGLSIIYQPVNAATIGQDLSLFNLNAQSGEGCIAPNIWNDTVRLYYQNLPSKTWTFTVEEMDKNVTLEFFWYQDYQKDGCPKDCTTDRSCQSDEIAHVTTPLGDFDIEDGYIGPAGDKNILKGVLPPGAYTVTANATGLGSVNIGLDVTMSVIPTVAPADTSTPTPTEIPPTATPSEIPVNPTTSPSPTATATPVIKPPLLPSTTPTATATQGTPVGPSASPTPTGTSVVNPPQEPSPTPIEENPTETVAPTTVATLPPPSGGTHPAVLIPVTGADLTERPVQGNNQKLFLNLGISLLGLGLIFHGLGNHLRKK